jgi:hypothetical protein
MTQDSTNDGCQYIGDRDITSCCGAECVPDRSYCADHVWLIYQEGTRQTRRRATFKQSNVEFWENLFNEAVSELDAEESA